MARQKLVQRRNARLSEGHSRAVFDYRIEYAGKKPVSEIVQQKGAGVEKRASIRNGGSAIYCGDNLGIMRTLLHDAAVCGKVTLAYIDPPFATGARLCARDEEHAYDDCFSGAEFLEFLRERLVLIHELLAPNGSLYVHLDAKKVFPIKVILDEVFGASGFRNCITRKKSNSKNFTRKQFGNISDYILFYTKSANYTWNRPCEAWGVQSPPVEYRYVEEETGRRYMKVPVHAPGVRRGETGQPWRGKFPPPGKHWQFAPSVLDELDAKGEIYWSPNGNPRRKVYLDESAGIPVQDIWLDFKDAHNQNIEVTGYPTEKNLDLLRRIVRASSNPGDLVLDCFMGSGTTLVAAEENDRRWIGIDASLKAVETTLQRLAHGAEKMGDYVTKRKSVPKSPSLFSTGTLQSGFDLFVSDGCAPTKPDTQTIERWKRLFN